MVRKVERDVRLYSDSGVGLGLGPLVSPEQADFPEAQCEAFWRMKQGPRNNESLL
jgi:hypothetical protein